MKIAHETLKWVWAKETVQTNSAEEAATTSFFNLKNKAEGARQYGYWTVIQKFEGAGGEVAYRGVYQTTLNGKSYQSWKYSEWFETEAEVKAALAKTVKGALKRYEKLAAEGKSKVEKKEAA